MRLAKLVCAVAVVSLTAACGGGDDGGGGGDGDGGNTTGGGAVDVTVSSIQPDHGPLGGGNTVLISGSGFNRVAASPNMLLIGGRLAESVSVLSDDMVEIVVPPGMEAGAVDVTLFNGNGTDTIADAYSYNPLPTITDIDPKVGDKAGGDTVTITGSGFMSLEPGTNRVWFGDTEATISAIASDSSMTVQSPPGQVLSVETVSLVNDNGSAVGPSFRYRSDGLLLFGHTLVNLNASGVVIFELDLSDGTVTELAPMPDLGIQGIGSAEVLADGRLLLLQRAGVVWIRNIDGTVETLGGAVGCARSITGVALHGGTLYATCRQNPDGMRFGTLDLNTLVFTPRGGLAEYGQRPALASDGATLYLISGNSPTLYTVNTADGATSNPVTLQDTGRVRGATFLNGTLYIANYGGTSGGGGKLRGGGGGEVLVIRSVNRATGATTQVGLNIKSSHGLTPVP